MEKSALQKARAAYEPKLPKALKGAVKISEGAPTQSVDNQEEIKKLFPNTYGMPLIEFVPQVVRLLVVITLSPVCSTLLRNSTPRTNSTVS